jgi:hypothetical protein
MAVIFNLEKQDPKSKLNSPKFRLYLVDLNNVDIDNWPVAADATISEDVLKTGKKWNYLDGTAKSINQNVAPGEIPENGVITLTPVIEGITKKSLQWVYDNNGRNIIAIWVRCSDNQKFIAGNPCSSGLKLTYTAIGQIDGVGGGISLQFQGDECPEPFYFYDGPLEVEPDDAKP